MKLNKHKKARISKGIDGLWSLSWYEDKDPKNPREVPAYHSIQTATRDEAIEKAKELGIVSLSETVNMKNTEFAISELVEASIKALTDAGLEVKYGKIRLSDVDRAIRVITASSITPEFMGKFVEALEAKGYKLGGHADMWRSPSVDDHTSTNVSDAGGDKLNVRLRFNPDGKKVTQKVVHDDPEDSDSWYFDYVIKDESEMKSVVHDVCKALKCKVTKFKIFQNMANFEMTKPEGLDIPFKMMAR